MALDDTFGEFVTYVYYLCHTFSLRLLSYVHPLEKHIKLIRIVDVEFLALAQLSWLGWKKSKRDQS